MNNTKRIVYNTGVLYTQLIIGVIIGLFSTRIVLSALGEADYGVYMLVAGMVGVLSILNSNMSITAMRFMAHSLGTADIEKINKTFNTTLILHFIVGITVVIIMEFGGWIMFKYMVNIPANRIYDAQIVFQFMIVSTFITVISVPYDAVMNAHENLFALSLADISGYVLKLGAALFILYKNESRLIYYGLLLMLIDVVMRIIKQTYSKFKYPECKIQFKTNFDKDIMKSILSFTVWNLFGSIGYVAVNQVRSLLLNIFFGVKINAAEGISSTASNQVNMVSVNLTRAINPQLVKSEGGGDRSKMLKITELSTKYSAFLFALIAIPVILETPFLLKLWLKNVPEFAPLFTRILLTGMLIEKFSFQITDAIKAVGNIRNFQVTETMLRLLNIPIAYFIFKLGGQQYTIFVVSVFITLIVFINRMYFGKKIANLNLKSFIFNAIYPLLIPTIIALIISLFVYFSIHTEILRFIVVSIIFIVLYVTLFYYLSMKKDEKQKLMMIFGFIKVKK
jgi:O-antigen/teichoic acid export membrane protein